MGVPVVYGKGKYYFGKKTYKTAEAVKKAGAKPAWVKAATGKAPAKKKGRKAPAKKARRP